MKYYIHILLIFIFSGFSHNNFYRENQKFIQLLKNKKILVVAPGSPAIASDFSDLKKIRELELIIPDKCYDNNTMFHSHSDEMRFNCLKDAIFDESTEIIWTLRGGYGSAKLINRLKRINKPNKNKIFIGFSDNTALHLFFSQEWNWKSIHGNGIVEILNSQKDRNNFIKIAEILSSNKKELVIDNLIPLNSQAKNAEILEGKMTGGNLTIVQTSIGTDWQIKSENKIIFLEDVEIKSYQLDRILLHFYQSGILKNTTAIIFGVFDNDNEEIGKVLKNFAQKSTIPIFKSNNFGHKKYNFPLIYNTTGKIFPSNKTFKLIMRLF